MGVEVSVFPPIPPSSASVGEGGASVAVGVAEGAVVAVGRSLYGLD